LGAGGEGGDSVEPPHRSVTNEIHVEQRIKRSYVYTMDVTFDPQKREKVLRERGLDFAVAGRVFEGRFLTLEDTRRAYGETRFQTYGSLDDRVVMVVWTPRGEARHIISMRYCHEREAKRVRERMG
jgi:uncharacterized DUF497 family protein